MASHESQIKHRVAAHASNAPVQARGPQAQALKRAGPAAAA